MSAFDIPPYIKGEAGYERYRTCTRKKRFAEVPPVVEGMRSYRCTFCDGYHLTSQRQRKFRKDAN